MQEAYKLAAEKSGKRKSQDVRRHDNKRPCSNALEAGDRVLVKNMSERGGTGKLRNFWEKQVHIVVEPLGDDAVVYKIKSEDTSNTKERILHRNMLLKCNNLLDRFDWNINSNTLPSIKDAAKTKQRHKRNEDNNR